MDFQELIKARRSVRSFSSLPVEDDKILKILEAARLSPSAANKQPRHFIVLKTTLKKTAIGRSYPREWFYSAPVVIVACGDRSGAWIRADGKNYSDVDVAIAFDHLTLAAAELGLGTCWIGACDAKIIKEVLQLPDNIEPVAMTPVGYPADTPMPKSRKNLDEIVHWEK